MHDAWTARKAEEIQGYADRNEWKNFFSAIKAVYGPPTKGTAPLLNAEGSTLLTEKTQIIQRWADNFRGVLNRPSTISDAAIDRLPQVETNVDLDLPPSLQETIRAVPQLSSGKAPGSDAIPSEVNKHGAKGERQVRDNHRGISLLKIAGKIFARILLNRLNNHLEQGLLPKSQCGFRRHRRFTDMMFAARQLQEKCQEMRTHLYSTFVNLTKAFDTVNREGLWKIMQKFGCLERFIQLERQLHDGMMARVTDNGAVSEAFAVTNGVKQGCVLAPTLFSLMFSAMLMDANRDEHPGIRIAYRTDGHLLNQRRMHFQSRAWTTSDCPNDSSTETSPRSLAAKEAKFHLQINSTNWEELALDRPTWRRKVKTGAAIYETNRIAAAKVKRIAWAYSATCASTTTCGRQPPATPHHNILPPSLPASTTTTTTTTTTITTPPEINTHIPHALNCHLPRKWEVCISTRSPCGFGCTGDLSLRLSRHVKRRGQEGY
nr:unnamed protein product [Spirometra erinaceieuropaei]